MLFDDHKDPKSYAKPQTASDFIGDVREAVGKSTSTLSFNKLRPKTLNEYVGQSEIKETLGHFINAYLKKGEIMNHALFATGSGKGKTTLAHAVAHEIGTNVFVRKAPVDIRMLAELMTEMTDGDILLIDEIHLQAKGRHASNAPEVLYDLMEDRTLTTEQGKFKFPNITMIGCTTDEGLLTEAFLQRFLFRPHFEEYSVDELSEIAKNSGKSLDIRINDAAAKIFASASQGVPRQLNNFVQQGRVMMSSFDQNQINELVAFIVLRNLKIEKDGLKKLQVEYLQALWDRRRKDAKGNWVFKCSLRTIAHGVNRGGDPKFVEQTVEPELVRRGLVNIEPGGRALSDKGMSRINVKREDAGK